MTSKREQLVVHLTQEQIDALLIMTSQQCTELRDYHHTRIMTAKTDPDEHAQALANWHLISTVVTLAEQAMEMIKAAQLENSEPECACLACEMWRNQ